MSELNYQLMQQNAQPFAFMQQAQPLVFIQQNAQPFAFMQQNVRAYAEEVITRSRNPQNLYSKLKDPELIRRLKIGAIAYPLFVTLFFATNSFSQIIHDWSIQRDTLSSSFMSFAFDVLRIDLCLLFPLGEIFQLDKKV